MVTKLATFVDFREKIIPIFILGDKVKDRLLIFILVMLTQ